MNNSPIKNNNDKEKQQKFEKILAKESPELLLELKKFETEPKLTPPLISGPIKLILFIGLINIIAGFILSLITQQSHFFILGSTGVWVSVPWFLAFLNGLLFIGYGIKVIKKKEGILHSSTSSSERFTVQEIRGEGANLLGFIYILLGIFLLTATLIRLFIQDIF